MIETKKKGNAALAVIAGLAVSVSMTALGNPRLGNADAAPVDRRQIVKIATEWYKGHFKDVSLSSPAASGADIVITGKKAYRHGAPGVYRFDVVVSPSNETIMVCGTCPIEVRKDRMDAVREFAVRVDFKMRESIATLYLDTNGTLRCRAAMPFDALLVDADEAMWKMVASVEEVLFNCEKAARRVCDGGCTPATAAGEVKEVSTLLDNCPCYRDWVDLYKDLPPVEDVVKRWFDKNQGYYEMHRDPCVTRFTGFWRIMDDHFFDTINYGVVIENGVARGICRCPVSLKGEDLRREIVAFVSGFNSRNVKVALKMDLDEGRLSVQHVLPVSVLRRPRSDTRLQAALSGITGIPEMSLWGIEKALEGMLGAK